MVYKALLWTYSFWISYINWYKFNNNNLSFALGSKQGGTSKLMIHKHEEWASIQLLTHSVLTFLFTLSRYQVILLWKQRSGNALSAWRNFHEIWLGQWEIFLNCPIGFCKKCQAYTFCSGYQFSRKVSRENSSTHDR